MEDEVFSWSASSRRRRSALARRRLPFYSLVLFPAARTPIRPGGWRGPFDQLPNCIEIGGLTHSTSLTGQGLNRPDDWRGRRVLRTSFRDGTEPVPPGIRELYRSCGA